MKRVSLTAWIFIAMVLGVAVGALYPDIGKADWMAALATVLVTMLVLAPVFAPQRRGVAFHRGSITSVAAHRAALPGQKVS